MFVKLGENDYCAYYATFLTLAIWSKLESAHIPSLLSVVCFHYFLYPNLHRRSGDELAISVAAHIREAD